MKTVNRLIGLPGLSNVGQVAEGIYRGAQPDDEGFITLRDILKINSIINLRQFHTDNLTNVPQLTYVRFPMTVFTPAHFDELEHILAFMTVPTNQPVFVHCVAGKDRTGYICAAYRILIQGWSVEEALEELQTFILSPFGELWHEITEAVKHLKK